MAEKIRVGIGGWTFAPWRAGVFYPKGLAQARELAFASRAVTSIEITGTYYGSQKPESFAKWHDETPDDFVFAVKGPRFATNRKVLAEGAASIERFLASGVTHLKSKLGPINWQLAHTKKFDAGDIEGFVRLLPKSVDGIDLKHAIEVRHDSFRHAEFVDLMRSHGIAIVFAQHATYPAIPDLTASFVYARLQTAQEEEVAGYSQSELDKWAERARQWAEGKVPTGLEYASTAGDGVAGGGREVFVYMIGGDKVKNPLAAQALIAQLGS